MRPCSLNPTVLLLSLVGACLSHWVRARRLLALLVLASLTCLLAGTQAGATSPASTASSSEGGADASGPGGEPETEEAAYVPVAPTALPQLAEKSGPIVVIPISGTVELGMSAFVERALSDSAGADLVILDVNTFGGRVDAAVKIRDALLATKVPTLAFVNRRAISAGALISLAADHIVFTSGASLGAATPVQIKEGSAQAVGEKMTSYMRSEMRATAEAKGRDGDLAEAMVDASVVVPGVSKAGKLLTVSTDLALELGLAAAEFDTLDGLLEKLGRRGDKVTHANSNWAESVVRFLTEPTLSGLLMSIGMAALLIDIYTAGFGLTGLFGFSCLGLFFGGHYIVGLAGWEEVLLFMLGIGALLVEVFVVPGFGVAGVIGIAALLSSATMTMLDMSLWSSWESGFLTPVLGVVLSALIGAVVLVALGFWLLGRRRERGGDGWLVLRTTLAQSHAGAADHSAPPEPEDDKLVGLEGEALTDLRPSGKAKIDGVLQDVVSQLGYVERGARVKIVEVDGPRIVVVEVKPENHEKE